MGDMYMCSHSTAKNETYVDHATYKNGPPSTDVQKLVVVLR